MNRNSQQKGSRPASLSLTAALLYALLLIYGTLFSPKEWVTPGISPFRLMWRAGFRHASWADMVTNLLIYMPLGFLLMRGLPLLRRCRGCKWLLVLVAGTLLSLTLEYLQAYIPGRTSSMLDLLLNAGGTGIGALLALLIEPGSGLARRIGRLRHTYIRPGAAADIGLLTLGMWALAQLSPLVPSLDLDNLRHGLKPLFKVFGDPNLFSWLKFAEYATGIAALGILYSSLQRYRYLALSRYLAFAMAVLLAKVLVVSRQLSPEALLGLATAAIALPLFRRLRPPANLGVAALLLVAALILESIQPGNTLRLSHAFNWIPFRGHLSNNINGIMDILAGVWPIMALATLGMLASPRKQWRRVMLAGTLLLFLGIFALEWLQLRIPGRSADITDALVATLAWVFPWIYYAKARERQPTESTAGPPTEKGMPPRRVQVLFVAGILATAGGLWALASLPHGASESSDSKMLPDPEDLPPVALPGFRYSHPRLPAPSHADMATLKEKNPRFLKDHLKRAKGGHGKLESVIISAYFEPGSQDLGLLFERLMKLKPSWRGHQQAKPLALAYDWLYDQWSPQQRTRLARKVVDASEYLIHFIRKEKLSPYNVYLYNSPLQALMATAIAAYGDLPEAEPPMRWTADYWKQRVLPAWRQIMGRNGGWHEGAEYVGIGIGQAIYQLPAMWRKATGENLFANEPGIRGFADFLVYRTRPDHTHMRWGDGRFFDRLVPDRAALAMAVDNKAAYSLRCPKPSRNTAWPWGPLSSNDFCDKKAREHLPLQKLLDGLGMIVARSDWSDDATYATFKAGDNYWSHTHLDQGGFTLFKGGPLVIDSGYYGPGYGSDHHMNYAYQTIAHNVITVTDPEDTIPMPSKKRDKEPRPIANDGGQRRIGSGWGKRAPLDLAEWQEQREIYHTGRIAKYYAEDDLVVAVAELTPAYTNTLSGKGTFAHRTFRIRKYWRTFIYDRAEDLVIVYDDVVSSDPAFLKRSLVHTLHRPTITTTGFSVNVPPRLPPRVPARSGGHLEAHVLFPRKAKITLVGGKGREFWVDGKNYDAGGKIWERIARRKKNPPEPGRWRVEISPPTANERDRFLMVLIPGILSSVPLMEPIEKNGAIGVRILGRNRSLQLLFPSDREGVIVEREAGRKKLDLTLPMKPPIQRETSFWEKFIELFGP